MTGLLKWATLAFGFALAVWTAGSWYIVAGIEEAAYVVEERRNGYEVRAYAPALAAETAMPSLSREDTGKAFRAIAGYIFGGNESNASIAMTAPVVMAPAGGEKIAMTAPVLAGDGTMKFILPSKYKTLSDLPKPKDPRVSLRALPGRRVAALRFSWYATPERVAAKSAELTAQLDRDGLKTASPPYLASYDPPFSAPFLKRHEILVDLDLK